MKYILPLFLAGFMCLESLAQTKRYRQRNNKIQTHFDMSLYSDGELSLGGPFQFSYTRNFKMFEVGGFLDIDVEDLRFTQLASDFKRNVSIGVGVLGQLNFIENKRKMKFVPSLGLKLGWMQAVDAGVLVALYVLGEYFVSSRTSIGGKIEYPLTIPITVSKFKNLKYFQTLNVLINFSYYFH